MTMAGDLENNNTSHNNSIGWDASLTNKYKEVDINDYSRFDKIKDSDTEEEEEKKEQATKTENDSCRNCGKAGAKLKCSVCKKAVYCVRSCQASDWQFHKRTCKKPEPPKNDPVPPKKTPTSSKLSTTTPSSTSTTGSTSANSTTGSSSTKKPTTSSNNKEIIKGEENAEEMRGYKNGLPYFHRELTEEDQKLIGDIAPKKVEDVPKQMPPANSVANEGSAWNHAGTFEERNYTKWAHDKLSELLVALKVKEGNLSASIQTPEKITGDASICVVRGKKRYLYDFEFKLPFEITIDGKEKTFKGSYQMMDISNDEDYEITYSLSKKPRDANELKQVQDFVKSKSSGLQKEVLRVLKEFAQTFQSL